MQGFFAKFRAACARFMMGRHGADSLSTALVYAAIVLNLLALIPYMGFLSTLSLLMLIYAIYRMFSKNNAKRYAENAWFLKHFGGIPTRVKQAYTRFKNRKKYLYFDCPDCHAKLRLPRGVGEVTVSCGRCGKSIRKSA